MGFVEGEGTFGYKHLVPYFQIAQNEKNLFVLEAIENYLLNTFNLPRDLEVFKYSLNKGTGPDRRARQCRSNRRSAHLFARRSHRTGTS